MLSAASMCDGRGKCVTTPATTCGGYVCETATTCKATCLDDSDCASPSVCGKGSCGGLLAQYFRQTNLTDLAFVRTDPTIDFDWGFGSPSPLLNVDNFSVRWSGTITARFTEPYVFVARTDDGDRLWVGDRLLIDHFVQKAALPEDDSLPFMMQAGRPTSIQLEYFEGGGTASARLLWKSAHEPLEIIPTSALAPQ
jgi:hypothetical protein